MLPGEVDEAEDGVKSGDEHNERNKNNRASIPSRVRHRASLA